MNKWYGISLCTLALSYPPKLWRLNMWFTMKENTYNKDNLTSSYNAFYHYRVIQNDSYNMYNGITYCNVCENYGMNFLFNMWFSTGLCV